ncbi:MAG: hypothetical protein LBQ07_01035 [Endomicrobium sp.]|jgi:hypothetical protein|nr:hypothetical protein [Endomicrobium sp.]
MLKMRIVKIFNNKQFMQFVRLPWKIYSGVKQWVPPLISDVIYTLSENKNPFWMHAKRQLFLAYDKNNDVVGRIVAIIDYSYISFHNDKCGFFGFYECINDLEVAMNLFISAENWLKDQNIYKMIGPMNPSINYECGFLYDGFNINPSFMMPYTHKYYLQLVEKSGLKKIKELYAYNMNIMKNLELEERLKKIVIMTKKRIPTLRIRNIQKKTYKEDLNTIISIYNCAWEENWGFIPYSMDEFLSIATRLKTIIDPEMILIATIDDLPIGIIISLPDYNQVLKRINGKLFPIGLLKILYYRTKIDSLRLVIMGIIKGYRHKGIAAVMCEKGLENAIRLGYKHCEFSWILDNNIMTQHIAEIMNAKIYKKYAIYSNK